MQSAQYTSDADIKEACAAAGVQIAFTDVCFLEHKVNGKSKGCVALSQSGLSRQNRLR